jgi:amino-acid N-acetyltransferase
MPQLYLDEYIKNLVGRSVCVACREGILRDNLDEIVGDIKFLVRNGVKTTLFHNLPNRVANNILLKKLERRLSQTRLIRIDPESNFYAQVLDHPDVVFKLIFLERRYLIDTKGNKINTLTTKRIREAASNYGNFIANVNFRDTMNRLCEKIEAGECDRIHILPAGKHTIKHELFTVEGTGTMLADNFIEEFRQVKTDEEVAIVARILSMYKGDGYLKPRSKQYLNQNRHSFFVTAIDGIVVGCMERKIIDDQTVELGAVAISTRFRNQRVGVYTVNAFMKMMVEQGYSRFISLTLNPRLQALYKQLGFSKESLPQYSQRQKKSPEVQMFYKEVLNND